MNLDLYFTNALYFYDSAAVGTLRYVSTCLPNAKGIYLPVNLWRSINKSWVDKAS